LSDHLSLGVASGVSGRGETMSCELGLVRRLGWSVAVDTLARFFRDACTCTLGRV